MTVAMVAITEMAERPREQTECQQHGRQYFRYVDEIHEEPGNAVGRKHPHLKIHAVKNLAPAVEEQVKSECEP